MQDQIIVLNRKNDSAMVRMLLSTIYRTYTWTRMKLGLWRQLICVNIFWRIDISVKDEERHTNRKERYFMEQESKWELNATANIWVECIYEFIGSVVCVLYIGSLKCFFFFPNCKWILYRIFIWILDSNKIKRKRYKQLKSVEWNKKENPSNKF